MPTTVYPHIEVDDSGTARVEKTRYKVLHLAAEHYHYGWSAEELMRQHPDLRPEEVYAALTYFYDHRDEMLSEMEQRESKMDVIEGRLRTAGLSRTELLRRTSLT